MCGCGGEIITFDPPGSVYTTPTSINAIGAIAGLYTDSSDLVHGFLRYPDGTITSFDPPDSTYTAAVSINRDAAIAGFYYDSRSDIHGFVRAPDGAITTFDITRATSTQASSIDDQGRVAGFALDKNFTGHGFVRLAGWDGKDIRSSAIGLHDCGIDRSRRRSDNRRVLRTRKISSFTGSS